MAEHQGKAQGETTPFFTIVVPCYNVDSYIAECIAALRAQTFTDFEVLCLDDGSTDRTRAILEEAIGDDSHFRILASDENQGVSFQRNRGLKSAKGSYVLFFDGDDHVASETLEAIHGAIEEDGSDIVVFGGYSFPSVKWIDENMLPRRATLQDSSLQALFDECGSRPFMCNKAYRRSMLVDHGCRFDEALTLGEDHAFQLCVFPHAHTISFIPDKLYHYRTDNDASAMAHASRDEQEKASKHVDFVNSVVVQWSKDGWLRDSSFRKALGNWAVRYLFDGLMRLPENALRERAQVIASWFNDVGLSEDDLLPENALRLRCIQSLLQPSRPPEVTVVMPMYNAERFLEQALLSLRAQTWTAFEAIMVDDGSTDATVEIAQNFVSLDSRFKLLQQEHLYAGEARNKGIDVAQGDYLLFLDADDWFDASMIERALSCAKENDADICAYRARAFDMATNETRELPWTCRPQLVNHGRVFSSEGFADSIFRFTSAAPWSKLFRTSFVRDKGLRFQRTRSANDVLFVLTALAEANRIVAIEDVLLTYRINAGSSLQSTQHKDPLAFYQALRALDEDLRARDLYQRVGDAFRNFALDCCLYNLSTLKTRQAFDEVYRFLADTAFMELDIIDAPAALFQGYAENNYERMRFILANPPSAYLKKYPSQHSVPSLRSRTVGWLRRITPEPAKAIVRKLRKR